MDVFQKLGAEIEESWREQNYDEGVFPKLAAEALERADLPSKISAWEVIEWTLDQTELPPQMDPNANFGDPPITLAFGRHVSLSERAAVRRTRPAKRRRRAEPAPLNRRAAAGADI